jgi:hypothetical protein
LPSPTAAVRIALQSSAKTSLHLPSVATVARKVLGWPERPKLAQLLGQLGVFLTCHFV